MAGKTDNSYIMNLHELKIWMLGFSAAVNKTSANNPLSKEQWDLVLSMIMSAQDQSTLENQK